MNKFWPTYRPFNLGDNIPKLGQTLSPKLLPLLFLLFPLFGFSQNPFQNPSFLNHLDGMPSDRVLSLAKDDEGFMWFGTDEGLIRYDGTLLEIFTESDEDTTAIKSSYIIDILPDGATGKIWVCTLAGLSVYDPATRFFKNYKNDPSDPNSIPDFQANRILKDKEGRIWIGFRKGGVLLYRPESDDFEQYICGGIAVEENAPKCAVNVTDLKQDPNNDSLLWLGTSNGLIRFNKWTGDHESFIYELEDKKQQTQYNDIRAITFQPNGKIYYGTWWEGVFVFDIKSQTFSPLDPCYKNGGSAFARGVSLGFYQKSPHEFWINSTMGTQLYDTRSGCITQTYLNDKEQSFAVDYIDEVGRIWSASRRHGVVIFNPLIQQSQAAYYEPLESEFTAYTSRILEDTVRKKLLVASDISRGLYILDLATSEWKTIPPPENYDFEWNGGFRAKDMIFLENQEVLIIDYNGLFWYKPGFERLRPYPLQSGQGSGRFHRVMKDSEGQYWITSRGYPLRLDVKNQRIHYFDEEIQAIWKGQIICDHIAEDKNGNIWMRELNGLLIYNKANNRFIYHQHDPSGRPAFRGMGVIETDKDGGVWIASNRKYLAYAHADSIEQGVLKEFGRGDGLVGDIVNCVKSYNDQLLIFSDLGVQFFDPYRKRFGKHYDARYGLNWELDAITLLTDERIAVSNLKRVELFDPNNLFSNAEKPIPYVSSFRVFDKTWDLKNKPSQSDTVLLSYRQNFFSFEFSAIAYNLPDKVTFQYKLEGIDENWQDGTKRKFAAYTNVPGGDYRFFVRAVNNEGLAMAEPSVTYLHISTVWWKTIWFWGLVFVSLMALGFLVYKWRIGQVRKEERLKAEYERKLNDVEMSALRAQMNPHFIFNSLNSIEYYIITNNQEMAVDYLSRFSRLIRLILQNSKSTIVPLKDDLEALKLYIEIESMRFDNKFDYEVKMETGIDPEQVVIPPMLMQPFVENSIWHGLMQKKDGKGKIDLSLRRSNGHLICLIEDNGIGREVAQQLKSKSASRRKSFGMKITSDRLAILNKLAGVDASVQIFDLKNDDGSVAGTRVELVIPL